MAQYKIYYFTAILLAVYLIQECNGETNEERNNIYLYVKLKITILLQKNIVLSTY